MDVLARVSSEDRENVRKSYETDENKIREQVEIIQTWIQQQRHLPSNQDPQFLENILLRNKLRIEQTKSKLENYYTLKGLYREFFDVGDYDDFLPTQQTVIAMPLPILSEDLGRLLLLAWRKHDPADFDLNNVIKFAIMGMELLIRYDYSRGEKIIIDCAGVSLEHLKKINVADLQKVFNLHEKAYSGRILSIDIINAPSFTATLLSIFKMVFSEKIYNKIKVHSSPKTILETHGKERLPSDYGGDLQSLEQLQVEWDKVFKEQRDYLKFCASNVSNEALRVGDVRKDENFGADGTFKKLNLD